MLVGEAGLDHAMGIGIVQVTRTQRDGSRTPGGNYAVFDGNDTELETGQTFPVAVIDFREVTRQL